MATTRQSRRNPKKATRKRTVAKMPKRMRSAVGKRKMKRQRG
jgi:hypothetical protein